MTGWGPRLAFALLSLTDVTWAGEPSARSLTKQGEKAEKGGNVAGAVLLYNQAAAKGSMGAGVRARSLMGRIVRDGMTGVPSLAATTQAAAEELVAVFTPITDRDVREARELLPPPELTVPVNAFVLDLLEAPQKLWESTGKLLGLDVLFDGEYTPGGQPVRFRCGEHSARQVLHGLSAATGSFELSWDRGR